METVNFYEHENKEDLVMHLILNALGSVRGDKKFEEIVERDEQGKVKPFQIRLEINGHELPVTSFLKCLENSYDSSVREDAVKVFEEKMGERIADIHDLLFDFENSIKKELKGTDWERE